MYFLLNSSAIHFDCNTMYQGILDASKFSLYTHSNFILNPYLGEWWRLEFIKQFEYEYVCFPINIFVTFKLFYLYIKTKFFNKKKIKIYPKGIVYLQLLPITIHKISFMLIMFFSLYFGRLYYNGLWYFIFFALLVRTELDYCLLHFL